jgi:lysophospholipase L1-like esterase
MRDEIVVRFYGDSFVAGWGDPFNLGWVGRVAQRCALEGTPIDVINHGVPGETSVQAVARWMNTDVAAQAKNTRVVFSFGTNDVITGTTAEQSQAALIGALDRADGWGIKALVVGPPPVGDLPAADLELRELSESFHQICVERRVPFIPTHDELSAGGAWVDEASAGDGSHPQGDGYAQLADLLLEAGIDRWLTAPI